MVRRMRGFAYSTVLEVEIKSPFAVLKRSITYKTKPGWGKHEGAIPDLFIVNRGHNVWVH